MKKRWFGSLVVGISLIITGLGGLASAQNVQDFTIQSFTADYYLNRNAQKTSILNTAETITAIFPNYDQNHGILRALPESYQGHTTSLKITSVTDENTQALNYTTYGQNGNLVLKIGDKNVFVHGQKTYKISYDQKNVVGIYADHNELYWDVNGDQWQQPFADILARIHIPADLTSSLQDRSVCYVGSYGSNDQSRCQISPPSDENGGQLINVAAKNLSAGENLSFVIGFKPGTFKLGPEVAQAQRAKQVKYAAIAGATIAPVFLSIIYLYTRWRRYGRDPKGRGVIIPEYQPPKGLNALTSDYVYLEKLDNKAISALIVELAIRKYLTIYEVKQDQKLKRDSTTYKLKLIRDPATLTSEEQAVLKMFFGSMQVGAEADLTDLKNKLASDVKKLKKSLGKELFAKDYFRSDPNLASIKYYGVGLALAISGFFLLITGLFTLIALSVVLSGLSFLIFSRYMPSRSEQGVVVHDHMLGLRDYIKLAEADRLKFLQSPQGAEKIQAAALNPDDPRFKVKLFESLLPYAMLFGLEKDWAKQFADIYKTAPDWYSGQWGTFSTVYLASSLGSFSNVSAVTFTAPSSSGGSGFGGGFSGGGGGGGGGGGW